MTAFFLLQSAAPVISALALALLVAGVDRVPP
jgi:hypothetical protein